MRRGSTVCPVEDIFQISFRAFTYYLNIFRLHSCKYGGKLPSEECPGLPVATTHGTDASLVVVSSLVNGETKEEESEGGGKGK